MAGGRSSYVYNQVLRPLLVKDGTLVGLPSPSQNSLGRDILRAVISIVPEMPVTRGTRVTLSGNRSTGSIKSYGWTFSISDSVENDTIVEIGRKVVPSRVARKEGSSITLVPLRSLTVTLTISDGVSQHSESLLLRVKPRAWRTGFKHSGEAALVDRIFIHPAHLPFGKNVCTFDGLTGEQSSGHYFHKRGSSWEDRDVGYTLQKLDNPGGSFDGFYYVADFRLRIDRTSLINSELKDGQRIHITNKAAGNEGNFKTLVASVRAHEQMHSTLLEEELKRSDPAIRIEAFAHPDAETLRTMIEVEISQAEEKLGQATGEDNVKARLRNKGFAKQGKVLLPVSGSDSFEDFVIPSFADLGDPG